MKTGMLILSLLFVTAGQAPQEAPKVTAAMLQGSWAVTLFNGEPVPAEAEAYLVFNGDKYEQWTGSNVDERGTTKIDVSKKPMAIDLIIVEGPDAGKTQLGVFELAGDTLSVTLSTPGDLTRPAAINQGELQVVLKKSK